MITLNNHIIVAKAEVLPSVLHTLTGPLGAEIDRLNQRYSFITLDGQYQVYDHKLLRFLPTATVEKKHKRYVQHQGKKIDVIDVWMSDAEYRREYEDVVFSPYTYVNPLDCSIFNNWKGWNIEPAMTVSDEEFTSFVTPWLDHILNIFASGDQEQADYFIHWLAHMFQKPEEKPGVAVIIQSGQGFGKGLITTLIQHMVGYRYTGRITDSHQLAGGFSGHLRDKIFVNIDEATWGGDKRGQGRLKALITESRLMVEAKHSQPVEIDHFSRFLITTNSKYPVPIELDDRRYFVMDVTREKPSLDYFKNLHTLNNTPRAIACIMSYFLSVNLDHFNVRHFPSSQRRQELQHNSIACNDVYQAFFLAAHEGELSAQILFEKNILASFMYEGFQAWKDTTIFKNSHTTFRAFLNAMREAEMLTTRTKRGAIYHVTPEDVTQYLLKCRII